MQYLTENKTSRRLMAVVLLTAIAAFIFNGCGSGERDESSTQFGFEKNSTKLQVGVITSGPVSDWGWNYQQNQGRMEMEARLRDSVNTVLVENIPENADVERIMQRMIASGANAIFSTSYGYADFVLRVAEDRPNVTFMQAQAPISVPNANTYNGSIWEAAYVTGVVAATSLQNETRFGFVGAQPIPPINWTVNAFILGARSVNPAVTVDIVYTNSWNNPAAETEAVKSLAAQGAKVVYILVDSPIAGVQAAEQAGIYSISHHADLSSFAPRKYLTGAMWDWTNIYVDVAQKVAAGSWTSESLAGGFKEGYVKLAPFGPDVDAAAQKKARDTIDGIISGQIKLFEGPLMDNSGQMKVQKGEVLDVDQIVSMDWLVEGIRASR